MKDIIIIILLILLLLYIIYRRYSPYIDIIKVDTNKFQVLMWYNIYVRTWKGNLRKARKWVKLFEYKTS